MSRPPDTADGARLERIEVRATSVERAEIRRVAAEQGATEADALRSLPLVWSSLTSKQRSKLTDVTWIGTPGALVPPGRRRYAVGDARLDTWQAAVTEARRLVQESGDDVVIRDTVAGESIARVGRST